MPGSSALKRFPLGVAVAVVAVLAVVGAVVAVGSSVAATSRHAAVSVRVVGNHLIDNAGKPFQLVGVNRSGPEFACIQGKGVFDGPSDVASITAMASWHINSVRLPMNEDCWLGINGVKPAFGGANYRSAIKDYVQKLHTAGMYAILDLHWSAPSFFPARGQQLMADADHSIAFWTSVATEFKSDPGVIFDLFNEPRDISWTCLRDGCVTGGWRTAGMQAMVNAVRATGATQPVMIAGLGWGGNISKWLAYRPTDPANAIVADVHLYNFSGCATAPCWDGTFGPVAAQFPMITGEFGEIDCAHTFIDRYMTWADKHGVSYLPWAWNAGKGWPCASGPSLITSYDGTATPFGEGFRLHLAATRS